MATTVSGGVYSRLSDGSIGPKITGVALTFRKEDGSATHTATSDAGGRYSISLPSARYYLKATHASFEDHTSAPGFLVATGASQTCNFFLRPPTITTAFVVRHGEKLNPNGTDQSEPLSDLGKQRALRLRDTLLRAGVTRIFSTDFVRTRETARPLAEALGVPVELYETPEGVVEDVITESRGDIALVVAHSNTVSQVISGLGPSVTFTLLPDSDFDNLFVVSRAGSSRRVVNLQYGADTTATVSGGNKGPGLTVLLVGSGGAGVDPARLTHAARRAGVTTIFARTGKTAMVTPLANALSQRVNTYESTGHLALVSDLLANHANDTVVVSGERSDLTAIMSLLGAPAVVVYTTDAFHMIVCTRFSTGRVRAIPTLMQPTP